MTQDTTKYAVLLRNIADRAEAARREDASPERCEILVRLYNDYLKHLKEGTDQNLAAFGAIEWTPGESPEFGLTEVMIRADHLAAWLEGDAGRGRRLCFEVPPMPSVYEVVDRDRIEEFSQEMQDWAVSVSERAVQLSQELSREIPARISRYFGKAEGEDDHRLSHFPVDDRSWRMEILTRVQDGELTAEEALELLQIGRPIAEDDDGEGDRSK